LAAVYWLGLWVRAALALHAVRYSDLGDSQLLPPCIRIAGALWDGDAGHRSVVAAWLGCHANNGKIWEQGPLDEISMTTLLIDTL